jgi:murein DD-endopeptidase MepM/ murein hydrolase activator NlpD
MFQPLFKNFQFRENYKPVDLSKSTLNELSVNPQDHDDLSNYLDQIKTQQQAKVLFGGYFEERSLYNKKSLFNTENRQRNIHLGVDFWAEAGEEVTAPFDGIVHSFADNEGFGNYGPCIILKHQNNQNTFYSLYGHLSRKSLDDLELGQNILKSQVFCSLGQSKENGGYVPHLHFQLIKDIGEFKGDYPGVCHKDDLYFYEKNTISPVQFLGL